jgi:hypothetical protein
MKRKEQSSRDEPGDRQGCDASQVSARWSAAEIKSQIKRTLDGPNGQVDRELKPGRNQRECGPGGGMADLAYRQFERLRGSAGRLLDAAQVETTWASSPLSSAIPVPRLDAASSAWLAASWA